MIQIGETSATIDSPVEHLMACHRRIEQRLETLVKAAAHLPDDPRLALHAIARSIQFLDSNGALHTEDEEASVFPRLRPRLSTAELAFIELLETQHLEAEAIFLELKSLASQLAATQEPAADLIDQYLQCATRLQTLYRDHIRSEDEILNPIAERSLTESDLTAIASEMRERREAGRRAG